MTGRMQKLFTEVPTVVISTATVDGTPNSVPVGSKKIIDKAQLFCESKKSTGSLRDRELANN